MARKVNIDLIRAIRNGQTKGFNNTLVSFQRDVMRVHLHGHKIAEYNPATGILRLDCCGYHTNVTRDRMNAVLEACNVPTSLRIRGGILEAAHDCEQVAPGVFEYPIRWDNATQGYKFNG